MTGCIRAHAHCRSDTDVRLQEVRTSVASQHLPIFTRLMDKDSHWGPNNGLRSLIPSVLLYGIVGYPFVLPDMIGGNAYNSIFIHRYNQRRWNVRQIIRCKVRKIGHRPVARTMGIMCINKLHRYLTAKITDKNSKKTAKIFPDTGCVRT